MDKCDKCGGPTIIPHKARVTLTNPNWPPDVELIVCHSCFEDWMQDDDVDEWDKTWGSIADNKKTKESTP